jgi:LAO/AO transport system kinase
MEIADIFVVNKADREGADRLMAELRLMRDPTGAGWVGRPYHRDTGSSQCRVEALYDMIDAHRRFLEASGINGGETASPQRIMGACRASGETAVNAAGREDHVLAALVEQVMRAEVDPILLRPVF